MAILITSVITGGCSQNPKIIDSTNLPITSWKDDIESIANYHNLSYVKTNFMISVSIPLKNVDLVREFHHLRKVHPAAYQNIEMHTDLNEESMNVEWFPARL